jgi:hypothetical protein
MESLKDVLDELKIKRNVLTPDQRLDLAEWLIQTSKAQWAEGKQEFARNSLKLFDMLMDEHEAQLN